MVAISVDDAEAGKALAAKLSLTLPLLSDPKLLTIRAWGLEDVGNGIAWPATFVIDMGGVIRHASVSKTYPSRPTTEALLAALDALAPAAAP